LTRIETAVRVTREGNCGHAMKKLMPREILGAIAKRTPITRPITGARTFTGAGGG
jgi:hypothetical protein